MKLVPLVNGQGDERRVVGVAEVYSDGSVHSCRLEDQRLLTALFDTQILELASRYTFPQRTRPGGLLVQGNETRDIP